MDYKQIYEHYEKCLEENPNDFVKQLDWDNFLNLQKRYYQFYKQLEYVDPHPYDFKILDFGCGVGEFLNYLDKTYYRDKIEYTGLDISSKMIKEANRLHPNNKFICSDILKEELDKDDYEWIICNGVFTEKRDLYFHEMAEFVHKVLEKLWKHTNKGISFNVMDFYKIPKDKQRPELFFITYDELYSIIELLNPVGWEFDCSYGLNEYICHVYKEKV